MALRLITPFNDYRLKSTYLYGNHLPVGGIFLFSLPALLYSPLARRFCPRLALSAADLLVFWAMVTTGAGLASSGLWRYLGPGVVAPAYFANSGADWLPAFNDAPPWLLLSHDPESPLVQLPLQIAADRAGVLARSPALWTGCAVVMLLHGVNTLHHFLPSVPQILDRFDILGVQQTVPWNALGMPTLEIFLAVIGVIGLLPAGVAFSLWFTYQALHLVRVFRAAMGYDPLMHGPLDQEAAMGAGAFLVIAAWLVWLARGHLALAWRGFLRPGSVNDCGELMGYRTAVSLALLRIYFSVFLGRLVKTLIVRFGGLWIYRKAVPFFLGLLLGEGLFGGLAAVWGLCFGVSAPPYLPD